MRTTGFNAAGWDSAPPASVTDGLRADANRNGCAPLQNAARREPFLQTKGSHRMSVRLRLLRFDRRARPRLDRTRRHRHEDVAIITAPERVRRLSKSGLRGPVHHLESARSADPDRRAMIAVPLSRPSQRDKSEAP